MSTHKKLTNLVEKIYDDNPLSRSEQNSTSDLIDLVTPIDTSTAQNTNSDDLVTLVERFSPPDEVTKSQKSASTLSELIPLVERITSSASSDTSFVDTPTANVTEHTPVSSAQIRNSAINCTVSKENSTEKMLEKLLYNGAQLVHTEECDTGLTYYIIFRKFFYRLLNRKLDKICNFSYGIESEEIELTEEVNEENMVTQTHRDVYWMIRVRILSSGKFFCFRISNKEVMSPSRYIPNETDSRGLINDSAILAHYIGIKIADENYPTATYFTTPGWKYYQNRWVFVTNYGNVGTQKIPISSKGSYAITPPKDDITPLFAFEEFIRMRGIIPRKPGNALILQYFGLLATLTKLFQVAGFPIKFSVAAVGKTNSKKTSCSTIFSRLYKRKNGMQPDLNFKSTEIAMYEAMANCADSVLIVDDFVPPENAGQSREQAKKAEALVRSYGDRIPRKRSDAYAKANNVSAYTPITGCCLMTGEVWTGCKSSQSRVLKLEFDDNDVDCNILLHYQQNLDAFTCLILSFLGYVEDHVEEVLSIIDSTLSQSRIRPPKAIGLITPRLAEMYGCFEAIIEIFGNYAIAKGFWTFQNAKVQKDAELLQILSIIQENDTYLQTLSLGARICLALTDALESGTLNLRQLEQVPDNFVYAPTDFIAFEDSEFILIRSEILWHLSENYFRKHRLLFDCKSGRDLIAPLKAENLLESSFEGTRIRNSIKLTIGHTKIQQRFLRIRKSVLKSLVDNFTL
jgi:hypothetical protein